MMGMNELEPVLFTQFDNDFLVGIAYDRENAIDAFGRYRGGERFKYPHRDLHLNEVTARTANGKGRRLTCALSEIR